MKLKHVGMIVVSVLAMSSAAVSAAEGDESVTTTVNGGVIHFKGEVVNAACAIDSESMNQTVELGQVRSSRLAKAGDLSSAVGFNIKLNDCDTNVSNNAAVAFLGTTVTSNDDTLALQSSAAGSAQNVGIQILDRTGEVLILDGATFSAKTDLIDGFAPVIHGIARGTAQVSVKQNGYDVYQTTVPPGPFTIDDINSAANGGDLQVTIKEADGSIQTLYVPYSSVPVLQRAGYTRYALAMGEYRSGNNLQSSPRFIQGSLMHGLEGNWTPYGGMQIAEDYQAFNLGIGKDLGLFGAFSFDITQANTTLADGTRHSGQSVKSVYSKSFYQTGTNIQVAGYRYSTQGFYNLSDSAYSRMSGYTVKPPTGDSNEQTQFIDYFNLFYSKRGQEQISISQQLGNYGTTFFSASRQSYWNTSRSDQQISFGLNVPFGDITTSLNYSYSNNIWQNDRDHLLAFTLNVPFSHWMRTDSQSAFRNSNASYSMSNDLKGGMTNLSGVYGTLLPDNNLNYSVQVGNTHGGNTSSGTSGYSSLNYRGAYGNTNVGYSRSGDSSQIYYGMSGGIIAHADGITFGQPLGDTMVLVKAPGADNVKIENQTGIHTDWRGYAILPFATEYRENRVALNANSLADNVELDETVVTVIPTHGAIARATFNAQIGGKVLMTLKYGNKSVPFGAIVTHGENKNGSIVAENGQVYLTGLPQSGKLQVSWGNDKNSNCIVDYKLPEVSPGTLLNQQTAICR